VSTIGISILSVVVVLATVGGIAGYRSYYGNRATRFGYPSRGAYLRSVPRTDGEKREAIDQAFMGLVICLLGLMLPPFLLVGLFPLYVGGRKTVYVSMGLGLADDVDEPLG
jgi:hypothetical protein